MKKNSVVFCVRAKSRAILVYIHIMCFTTASCTLQYGHGQVK